jgi:large subunit ribosomal protein L25
MPEIVLQAQPREVIGKQVKALRREGRLPGVIYGRGIDTLLITLDMHDASRILPTITSSQLVAVEVDGKQHTTLVREKQRMPTTGALLHVDFQEVSLTEKLHANVIIELVGDSPAVKNYNGVLVAGLERLEVEALPRDLPERITVDVSILSEIGQAIHVRDIALSSAVSILDNEDEIIVVVTAQAAEEVEEAAEAGAFEPEVAVERGKKEEEF